MRFENKRAVVTGGASGIGRATVSRLAAEGAQVLIGDIDAGGAAELVAGSDGRIAFRHCDVTQPDQLEALMQAAHAEGGIDLLFNNAGAGGAREGIDAVEPGEWDRTMALLLTSVALGTRYAAPLMARRNGGRGGGAIVNTASVAALASGFAPTAYSVAKAGVLHLTKVSAADLAQHGIRVNAVLPGFITTNIFTRHLGIEGEGLAQANAMIAAAAAQAQPIARAGRPEDIAAAVCFLLSDDAAFVTGTSLLVDGGLTVGSRASWDPASPTLFEALDAFK
ncbi:MAG TPA: SDR family NAD(P)-dependent oxidoreductase [Sphingomonas sp.]|jgi:NAD(P)-dependent dehydrogenase (short-subunit alcohol dehydrogenase family)|uniref:SDR family NAD(P)-dependent oxidoreductase n=1 Tax=Sphingomonas sp. TaxID=28214 RepID=UPI002ED976D3